MAITADRRPFAHWTGTARTLVELGEHRARAQGNRVAFTFLSQHEGEVQQLTYGELDCAARRLAVTLGSHVRPGERLLLLCPPGPDFVIGLMGAFYAGVTAVPTYPPDPAQLGRTLPRLAHIAADSGARIALTSAQLAPLAPALAAQEPALAGLTFLSTAELGPESAVAPRSADDLAFLQYTSGSTGEPRGVAITHGNVLANLALIHQGVAQSPASSCVLWLPPYHDMGLLNLLYALAIGFPCVVMSPALFIQRPLRWLAAIAHYRATYSGGPNFAYDLCVRKILPEQRAALELSCWEVAFNGAEPVRAQTLTDFAAAFGPCGFDRRAFLPCYGLAEFTVAVSGGAVEEPPVAVSFDRLELQRGRAVPVTAEEGDPLIGCGNVKADHQLRIVDPVLKVPLPAGLVGEIWAAGPSMAQGYFHRPAETAEVFRVPLAGDSAGPYLRTGDLGFVHHGELFVVGRSKDLIILYGQNHAPHDLERSAEAAHSAVRPGGAVAFSIDNKGAGEQLVLCCEADPESDPSGAQIIDAIRRQVGAAHQVEVARVLLLPRGALPKTPSGKVQRQRMRERTLHGLHGAWAEWPAAPALPASSAPRAASAAGAAAKLPPEAVALPVEPGGGAAATPDELAHWLAQRVQALGGARLEPHESLATAGLDSLALLELSEDLSVWLGRSVPHTFAWEHPSLRAAAFALSHDLGAALPAPLRQAPRTVAQESSALFYQDYSKEEDRRRTNVHYEVPARFFEVMTGGRWQIYSCNLWSAIPAPDPSCFEHQTLAQEHKLDTFARLLGARPGLRVLEVGCAQGGALRYLAHRYGISGYGIALSERQVAYAREQAASLGVAVRYEVRHWKDLSAADGPFDAIISDEVIVHFFQLEQFFRRAFSWLADDGVMVHKEVHFTHPSYGSRMDRLAVLANDIFGGTGNYRTLAEELELHHRAGFHIDSVVEIPRSDYALTARSWYENLRRHQDELVELIGAARYLHFLKWVAWVQLGPGGQSQDTPIMSTHFVKSRKAPAPLRRRLGILDPEPQGQDE